MHPCLLVPDLVRLIAEECTWVHRSPEEHSNDLQGQHTLNSLARTCRAFLEPALDMLWYRQDTLTYLFKCLPEDLLEVTWIMGFRELVSYRSNIGVLRAKF